MKFDLSATDQFIRDLDMEISRSSLPGRVQRVLDSACRAYGAVPGDIDYVMLSEQQIPAYWVTDEELDCLCDECRGRGVRKDEMRLTGYLFDVDRYSRWNWEAAALMTEEGVYLPIGLSFYQPSSSDEEVTNGEGTRRTDCSCSECEVPF